VSRPIVNRFTDAAQVADGVAEAIIQKLATLLGEQEVAHFVLTGGTVGIATLARLSELDSSSVDWSRVHIWWGDERFVPGDSADRNSNQAKKAWLNGSKVPSRNIHEFPASDDGLTLEEARREFEKELLTFAFDDRKHPKFDLLLLGMGPDGHIASLFPGYEFDESQVVVSVSDSPKPPPMRLSLNFSVICDATEVWFTIAGSDKSDAVSVAFGDNPKSLPVGRVQGLEKTIWFVDSTAGFQTWGC